MKMFNKHKDFFLALLPFLALVIIFAFFAFKPNVFSNSSEVIGENTGVGSLAAYYDEYSTENLISATSKGKAVLFFATNWCSTCTQLDRELMSESEKLDSGITVLKLDFDNSTEFKKRYGVTVQHTLVQVDSEGNEITKWVGGDIATINKSVK